MSEIDILVVGTAQQWELWKNGRIHELSPDNDWKYYVKHRKLVVGDTCYTFFSTKQDMYSLMGLALNGVIYLKGDYSSDLINMINTRIRK